jgi:hypothetical protein
MILAVYHQCGGAVVVVGGNTENGNGAMAGARHYDYPIKESSGF